MAENWPYFSDEQSLRRPPSGALREAIPERVRNAVRRHLLRFDEGLVGALWCVTVEALDLDPGLISRQNLDFLRTSSDAASLHRAVESWKYADFLDVMTVIARSLEPDPARAEAWREMLNAAFARHHSAYRILDDGRIVDVGSDSLIHAAAVAASILSDTRMSGPDRQFAEAVEELQSPRPNYEVVVANAVNALEGTVRVIVGDAKLSFGEGLKLLREDAKIHPALLESLSRVFGYGSDAGGRHGVVGTPNPDRGVAEFVVTHCAGAIVMLARTYGFAPVESR